MQAIPYPYDVIHAILSHKNVKDKKINQFAICQLPFYQSV